MKTADRSPAETTRVDVKIDLTAPEIVVLRYLLDEATRWRWGEPFRDFKDDSGINIDLKETVRGLIKKLEGDPGSEQPERDLRRICVDAFDEAHTLGQSRAYLAVADTALQQAHAELAGLGDGPLGAALPRRYCEDASELLVKVRRMLLQAIRERR